MEELKALKSAEVSNIFGLRMMAYFFNFFCIFQIVNEEFNTIVKPDPMEDCTIEEWMNELFNGYLQNIQLIVSIIYVDLIRNLNS